MNNPVATEYRQSTCVKFMGYGRSTLASLALIAGSLFVGSPFVTPANATAICTGTPYTHGGTGSATYEMRIDLGICERTPGPASAVGFVFTVGDDGFATLGSSTGNPFTSCTTTSDNLTGIGAIQGITTNCNAGGLPSIATAGGPQTYNFTTVFVGGPGGDTYTLKVTMTAETGTDSTVTFMSISGGAFDPVAASTNTSSDALQSQQITLSSVGVTSQTNNMAGGVFDHLDDSFSGGGNGPQISANGFFASTSSVSNFLNSYQSGAPQGETALAGAAPFDALSPTTNRVWNAWIKGNWEFYKGAGSSYDGYALQVMTGVDYRLNDSTVIGVLGGYGHSDFDTLTNGSDGTFGSDNFTTGPYIGVKLSENLQLDAMLAYTFSRYDSTSGTVSGSFDGHRISSAIQLQGVWNMGKFFVKPGIRFVYALEQQDSYTDSASVVHGKSTVRAGRLSAGPKIGYRYKTASGGSINPWSGINAEYDFSKNGGSSSPDNALSARISAGIDAATRGGVSFQVKGDVSGLGGGVYRGYGGTARIRVPF